MKIILTNKIRSFLAAQSKQLKVFFHKLIGNIILLKITALNTTPVDTREIPDLTVIIPTINEVETLPMLLDQLRMQKEIRLQLIVADGGSDDGTPELVKHPELEVITTDAGRGKQMNAGAARAVAPYLLFLHADSTLTAKTQLADALAALEKARQQIGHHRLAGHFRLRFQRTLAGGGLAYRYYEEKSALNRRECTNGDQGLMLPRRFFQELGGFDETLWFLEDQRMAETIRVRGQWLTMPGELVTSARRFELEGLGRRMIMSALIMNFHHIGFSEFFHRTAVIYRNQTSTDRLLLCPIFQLIEDLNREAGTEVARKRWLATGRYVRGNAWQPFFFLDLLLQQLFRIRKRPFLAFHDRIFKPVFDFLPFDWLTAGLTRLWFIISWKYFKYVEQRASSHFTPGESD